MTPTEFVDSLGLPATARVDRVVPKKLLLENGARTASDRKAISAGIDKIHWLASLKPTNIGVPEFRSETHEYLEIAVIAATLRAEARVARLTELLHRAIPYPLLLVTSAVHPPSGSVAEDDRRRGEGNGFSTTQNLGVAGELRISAAEKRRSERQSEQFVMEFGVTEAALPEHNDARSAFALTEQPKTHLRALYQGWIAVLESIVALAISGRFQLLREREAVDRRREAIEQHDKLVTEIERLRKAAGKENRMSVRVEQNLEIQRAQAQLQQAKQNL